jgi:hypothetical protein
MEAVLVCLPFSTSASATASVQAVPLEHIPTLDVPLHTLIELQPMPDGTMKVCTGNTNRVPIWPEKFVMHHA